MRKYLQRSVHGFFWQKSGMMMFIFCVFMSGIVKGQGVQVASSETFAQLTTEMSQLLYYAPAEVDDKNRAALNRIISVELTDVPMEDALRQIAELGKLRLAYSTSVGKEYWQRKVSVQYERATVLGALYAVLESTDLKLTLSTTSGNGQIVVEKDSDEEAKKLIPVPVLQQEVTGRVTDALTGEALPGVTIRIKNNTTGTSTNADGVFELFVPSLSDTLIFSSIGYTTEEMPIEGRTDINVFLKADIIAVEELIIVGYGTQRKSDITGSVSSVNEENLRQRPVTNNIPQTLAGRMAGVSVAINNGAPGGGATNIRIRGNTSVSNTNDPLYVIDGVMLNTANLAYGQSPIDYIDSNNIESIEALKDASATAIYGARGANGVILITTKKGTREGGRVSYDNYLSVSKIPESRRMDLLNAEEFLLVEDLAYQNALKYNPHGNFTDPREKRNDPSLFDANGNPLYDTDWQAETMKTAIGHNHQLSFTNGGEDHSYGLFVGYRNEDGTLRDSWAKRYSGRFVIDSKINNWMTTGGSLAFNEQTEDRVGGSNRYMRNMQESIPIIPVQYPDGTWAENEDYPGMEGAAQPLNINRLQSWDVTTRTMLGNAFVNIDLLEGLEYRTMYGMNNIDQTIGEYYGRDLARISRDDRGRAMVQNVHDKSWQFENYLTYITDFTEKHSINALLGQSIQRVERFSSTSESANFVDDFFQYNNIGIGSQARTGSSGQTAYALSSYFGRVNYNIDQKYLFTVTGRMDGSSNFGRNNRYAFFPSAALAWRVSNEAFMQDNRFISSLKLRASYGVTGNSEIPPYQSISRLGQNVPVFNNQGSTGIGASSLANPELKWEKNEQTDMGLEIGFLNDRIQVEFDVYRRVSNDMLLNTPVPSTSGYTSVVQNIGSMENRGLEISLNTFNISTSDFSWQSHFNISFNRNEVLALSGGSDITFGWRPNIIREGYPVNSFYGYIKLGTWNTDEAEEAARYNRLPGDVKYKDINGDGIINQEDQLIIGNGDPKGWGSLINNFNYKNFELSLDVQFMYGHDLFYRITHTMEDRVGIANSLRTVLTDSWTPDNQDTMVAELRPMAAGHDSNHDSHYVKDGSFIRGRNLLVAYNFSPRSISQRVSVRNLRVYASLQNFFLITNYQGYDPEASSSDEHFNQGDITLGDAYPKPRVFTLGMSVNF